MEQQFTSFGTCNLMEADCGDARLLDKILLCFLKNTGEDGDETK